MLFFLQVKELCFTIKIINYINTEASMMYVSIKGLIIGID